MIYLPNISRLIILLSIVLSITSNVFAQSDTIFLKNKGIILCKLKSITPPNVVYQINENNQWSEYTIDLSSVAKITYFKLPIKDSEQKLTENIPDAKCDEAATQQAHSDIQNYTDPYVFSESIILSALAGLLLFIIGGFIAFGIYYYLKRKKTNILSLRFIKWVSTPYRNCEEYMKVIREKVWEVRRKNIFFAFLIYTLLVLIIISLLASL